MLTIKNIVQDGVFKKEYLDGYGTLKYQYGKSCPKHSAALLSKNLINVYAY
jgi:hypothetical protein